MDTINDQTQNATKSVDPIESTAIENSQQNEIPTIVPSEASNVQDEADDTSFDDTFADIDLSNLELSADFLAEMDQSIKSKEAFESIMNACSSTAQALKQTISDVLQSRENIVIAAGDTTTEFEATLNKKIADFENVVSGCCVPDDIKTDLTNIKHPAFSNVIITEVNESDEVSSDSSNSIAQVQEEKKNCSDNDASNGTDVKNENTAEKITKVISEDSSVNINKEKVIKDKETKTSKVPPAQIDSVPVLNASEDDKISKKQQKSNSNKKKGEKSVDQILRSLSNCSSVDDKLQTLCKRHAETLEELRLFEPRIKQLERQVQSQQREKEQLQTEHNRMILAKSRLESLCRELQRQNRAVKEESLLHIKEEEERRKEIANKFQATLNDISSLMQDHSKKNIQLREENQELAKKLKALVDHYDMWEKHMEKVVQQNHLEAQLAKAKHAKINLLLKQETEKFLREKQSLLENMSELQKKCTQLTSNELKLRTELGDYTSKYEEFQTVLSKSSQVFSSFKNDMETTSKKIKKLEKETNIYKQKWESSNNAMLGMINDKQKHDKELSNAKQSIQTLEKLCRALQAERYELRNQLNTVTGSAESPKEDVPSTTEAKA